MQLVVTRRALGRPTNKMSRVGDGSGDNRLGYAMLQIRSELQQLKHL
jgi:hypothetical protein